MKVKAKTTIGCDKGYFQAGDTFEIEPNELPAYGDLVEVVGEVKAPAIRPAPVKEAEPEPVKEEVKAAEEPVKAENRPRTSSRRKTAR